MRRHLPLILTLAAVAVAVSILGWQVWLTVRPDPVRSPRTNTQRGVGDDEDQTRPAARPARVVQVRPERDPNPEVLRSLDDPEPVKVELAGLLKYKAPLHANAPGRMPTKEGERTIGGDTLPPDPAAYAAGLPNIDPALLTWLREWQRRMATQDLMLMDQEVLETHLRQSDLEVAQLYEVGRGIAFVEGRPTLASSFYRRAVAKAGDALSHTSFGSLDEAQSSDRDALRHMARLLWEQGDFETTARLFDILTRVESPDDFLGYRARFLRAESIFMMRERGVEYSRQAAALFENLAQSGGGYEPNADEKRELAWVLGLCYYYASDPETARPYLASAVTGGSTDYYRAEAVYLLLQTLLDLDRKGDAHDLFAREASALTQDQRERISARLSQSSLPPSHLSNGDNYAD